MRHGMFSVKDKAADAFLPPFFLPTGSMAVREFLHAASIPDHKFCVHPHDYSLYQLGWFEDGHGRVEVFPEPLFMVAADEKPAKPVLAEVK